MTFRKSLSPSVICGVAVALWALMAVSGLGADWPMWRYDAGRSAASPERLPERLHLRWVRQLTPMRPAFWQAHQERLQFDLGYEPVVLGKTMFVGSSANDSLVALDTETGRERWRFYADGPVRFAPAAWEGRVYLGSDDGRIYCLNADDGRVVWSFAVVPSSRKVLGNGRLISVWPVRGGPVVAEGVVYFAAGVWPFEGLFFGAADAKTGKLLWLNDRLGSMYAEHPHAAMSFGGPSPQGYLVIQGDEVIAPGGRAFPAALDRRTGKLTHFEFGHGGFGSRPGSWFLATKAGNLCIDPQINTGIHDGGQQIIGQSAPVRKKDEAIPAEIRIGQRTYQIRPDIAQSIAAGGREFLFADGFREVDGRIHSMLAADQKLFVVSRPGSLYCFTGDEASPIRHPLDVVSLPTANDSWHDRIAQLLRTTGCGKGHALVWGVGSGRLLEELLRQSDLDVIAVDPDAGKVHTLRNRLDRAGLYGSRVSVHVGRPLDFGFPQYLATLLVSEDLTVLDSASDEAIALECARVLRPYGGTACLALAPARHQRLDQWSKRGEAAGMRLRRAGELSLLSRDGPPPGSADYTGTTNHDQLVAAPLGLLWFGDTHYHHKLYFKGYLAPETGRGLPQGIRVVGGVLRYATTAAPHGPNPPKMTYTDYLRFMDTKLGFVEALTDVYTGRVVSESELSKAAASDGPGDDGDRKAAILYARRNPITGIDEGREVVKTYGCDQSAVDYGGILTMRSGTGAFYDSVLESGTINVSGMRAGCRNSIVPGNGVLCLPSWTGNCTCNYPVSTSLALVHMPEEFEQWSAWGGVAVEAPVRRVGINFGAPGDRMTRDGTLWLEWPSVGGPSPAVPVHTVPEQPERFYRHAIRMCGGQGWPWVTASGILGVRSVTIEPMARRSEPLGETFSVRWAGFLQAPASDTYSFFARTDHGVRLWIDQRLVIDNGKELLRGRREAEVSGAVALKAGQRYPICLEYFHAKQGRPKQSRAQLSWSSPGTPKELVPAVRLFGADRKPGGLTGAYFGHSQLTGPSVLHFDPQIDFAWGEQLPAPLRQAAAPVSLSQRPFTVRLFFGEPEEIRPGERIFGVAIQGREVARELDIVRQSGGPHRGLLLESKGVPIKDSLRVEFTPRTQRPPLICGVELIAERIDSMSQSSTSPRSAASSSFLTAPISENRACGRGLRGISCSSCPWMSMDISLRQ